jgi:hypothetical protein
LLAHRAAKINGLKGKTRMHSYSVSGFSGRAKPQVRQRGQRRKKQGSTHLQVAGLIGFCQAEATAMNNEWHWRKRLAVSPFATEIWRI